MSHTNHDGSIWSNVTQGVYRRSGPGRDYPVIDQLWAGQALIILCYSWGDTESFSAADGHTYTSDAWDFVVTSDQDPGGYVADVLVDTEGDTTKQLGEQGSCDLLQQRLANASGSNQPLG
jgi:hypothetical protein